MHLYDKNGRSIRLTPPPRPADDAEPIGWVGHLAVFGEVNADWAHGETLTGFVTPAERAAVWASSQNWDGPVWDVPCVVDVPLNWRQISAERAAKEAAEQAAWDAGEPARKAAEAEAAANPQPTPTPEYHSKWGNFDRGESGRWDRHED
jgi:hypothetical protein